MANSLLPERLPQALAAINGWRRDPDLPVLCPVCGKEGLAIADCSVRPYAEWYALACGECGLNHTLNIPLAPPPLTGLD